MAPEIVRSLPPYMQVFNHLREEIVSGRLAEGETVPSERQLAADWGISRGTAAKVLSELRHENLIESQQGRGSVVRARARLHHSPADRFRSMETTGRIYPPGQHAEILSAGLVPAPARVALALALGTKEGERVIRRHRVTYDGDTPVSSSTSWYLVGYNSLFDAEGRVIEYGEYLSPGDRYSLYTFRRPRD
ncbi:GntR family transcriptional regulator [Streptomyces sp. NPDC003077]|uniref:GntR family transcriptional regulator n=1 Tax=Streptomyces sp. NPDC003077 TaxID=3154443 RepID=UPI0033B6BB6B